MTQFQVLLFAGFALFALLPLMKRTLTITLDFDWFYCRFLKAIGSEFTVHMGNFVEKSSSSITNRLQILFDKLHLQNGPHGILGNTSPSSSMVLWVAVILVASLFLYYF